MNLLVVLLVPMVALMIGAAAQEVWAETVEFAKQEIFFEFNSTDLDLGLHISFDAVAWEEVEVIGPNGEIFEVENDGALKKIGSTQIDTESAEPPLVPGVEEPSDEQIEAAIETFQARFPEGTYRFRGRTIDGRRLSGTAELEHALPAAPEIISPEEDGTLDPDDAVIVWQAGEDGPPAVRYEVVVEFVSEDERVFKYIVQVPANLAGGHQSMLVPKQFFDNIEAAGLEGEYKAEVLAIAGNRNATITEHEFKLK